MGAPAKFKEDLKTFEKKLERTSESLNLKFDTLNGEVHVAMTRVDKYNWRMRSASSLLMSTKRTKGFYHWNVTQEISTYDFTTSPRTQMSTY